MPAVRQKLHLSPCPDFRSQFYKAKPAIMHSEITVIDHALTHPWTLDKKYVRNPNPRPVWGEMVCAESNPHVRVGKDNYMISGDGLLMPVRKDQAPPDLKYFKQTLK